MTRCPLHHVEPWVPHLARTVSMIGRLLRELGHQPPQNWDHERSVFGSGVMDGDRWA